MVSSGAMYALSSTASSPSSSILYSLRDSRQNKSLNADCVCLEKIKRQLVEYREAAKPPARNKPALPSVPLAKSFTIYFLKPRSSSIKGPIFLVNGLPGV